MIAIKPGVSINGIRPEILLAMVVAEGVWRSYGRTLTITSCVDSKHSRASFHYLGLSFDGRTNDLPHPEKEIMVNKVGRALGEDFDVILEADHFHVEYQPKQPVNMKE